MAKKKQLKAVKAAEARKKRRNRRRKRAVILALEVIVLLVLSATAYVMAKYDKFQTVSIDSEDIQINEGVKREGYTTLALFGGDSREGQLEAGTHADTIMVAAINHDTKEVKLASVYRDTLVKHEKGDYNKANAAYFRGGPEEAINMLNRNLDLDIEDYATVDFKAMVDVIDLLGGIEINVTDEEADMLNEYLWETATVAEKSANYLEGGGVYNLDGSQAVTYARLRKLEGGDYKRAERQQLVMQKMFEKAKKMDIKTLNEIVDAVFPQVSTSLTLKEIISLGTDVLKYKFGDTTGFPSENTVGSFPKAGSVVIAQGFAENVEELHEFLYPSEEDTGVSDTVQEISDEIEYYTGVVRPASLDKEEEEDVSGDNSEQPSSDTPVITDADTE